MRLCSQISNKHDSYIHQVTAAVNSSGSAGLTFNCQLGRGRTTTGMVAAALVFNILLGQGEASDPLTSPITLLSQSITLGKEEDHFLQGTSFCSSHVQALTCNLGEYKNILRLMSILPVSGLFPSLLRNPNIIIRGGESPRDTQM